MITLANGEPRDGVRDYVFTDGVSLISEGIRSYYALASIAYITVHNP